MSNKIKSVKFLKDRFAVEAHAIFDDGKESVLFVYFPDELSFTEEELIGLTDEEAYNLFIKKDNEYLRS